MPIINMVYKKKKIPEWNWDISKATTYTRLTTSTSSEQMEFWIQFNPDWTKWYSACYNAANAPVIKQWTLSTPRDITTSTLQWSTQKGSGSSWGNYPSIYICNNGNYVYFCDNPHPNTGNWLIYLYSLSTPRDLSSTWTQIKTFSKQKIQRITWVSEDGKAFITAFDNAVNSRYIFYSTSSTARDWNSSWTTLMSHCWWSAFSNDWTKVYFSQDNSKVVYEYSLSTPYNPTTKTLVQSKTLDTVSNLLWITFDTGWDNLYVCANSRPSANYIYQYSLI